MTAPFDGTRDAKQGSCRRAAPIVLLFLKNNVSVLASGCKRLFSYLKVRNLVIIALLFLFGN